MSIISSDQRVTEVCPSWCAGHPVDHPRRLPDGSEPAVVHCRPIGDLGVAVEWCPADPNDSEVPVVYVPELDVDPLSASPSFARALGVDLIAAADLLAGGATGPASAATGVEVRARVARCAGRGREPLPPEQVRRAQDLAVDLLATFARHGVPAGVVENVTAVSAAAVDCVRWVSRSAVSS